jgi:hypothetical protein
MIQHSLDREVHHITVLAGDDGVTAEVHFSANVRLYVGPCATRKQALSGIDRVLQAAETAATRAFIQRMIACNATAGQAALESVVVMFYPLDGNEDVSNHRQRGRVLAA